MQPSEPKGSGSYFPPPASPAPPIEPGMYSDPYTGPGQYAEPTHMQMPEEYGERGPGQYEPPYHGPGQWAPPPPQPLEPGIYEERYRQPGQYAPQPASTYYGGQVWPPYNTGAAQPSAAGKPLAGVFTSHPASGAPTERRFIPSGGTELLPGQERFTDPAPMPGAMSRGDVLGAMSGGQGSAPPVHPITLGSTPLEMYYRMLQRDPGVVPTNRGKLIERRDLAPPVVDSLAGLFGGGERKSSQPMPLPPRLGGR
jgi:hypothetical protein